MLSHAVEKPGENGNTVFLVNATYGTASETARIPSAIPYAHRPDKNLNVIPAAAASSMQNATTVNAGALVRNCRCARVSNKFAWISTPASGIGEYGVSHRSLVSVWAVTPANTTFPAKRPASVGSSCSCLREIDGIL